MLPCRISAAYAICILLRCFMQKTPAHEDLSVYMLIFMRIGAYRYTSFTAVYMYTRTVLLLLVNSRSRRVCCSCMFAMSYVADIFYVGVCTVHTSLIHYSGG